MNDRELSMVKTLSEEFGRALQALQDAFSQKMATQQREFSAQVETLLQTVNKALEAAPDVQKMAKDVALLIDVPVAPELPDIHELVRKAVADAVASIPAPADGKSVTADDLQPMLQEMVNKAFIAAPAPKDGKDYDPDVLSQAVKEAVATIRIPEDGKSVTAADLQPMLQEMVTAAMPLLPDVKNLLSEAVESLPPPDMGEPGKDALQLEVQPCIDASKTYARGSYATHDGGLWRAYEKTHGMRGWECLVEGISNIDVSISDDLRNITVKTCSSSGHVTEKSFAVPTQIYRGVYKSGGQYQAGDTVTWAGSVWHCDDQTEDKPGELNSKGWTLAVKRGRDGRDKQ